MEGHVAGGGNGLVNHPGSSTQFKRVNDPPPVDEEWFLCNKCELIQISKFGIWSHLLNQHGLCVNREEDSPDYFKKITNKQKQQLSKCFNPRPSTSTPTSKATRKGTNQTISPSPKSIQKESMQIVSTIKDSYQCTKCPEVFKNPAHLELHLQAHGNYFACPDCYSGFANRMGLEGHRKRFHGVVDGKEILVQETDFRSIAFATINDSSGRDVTTQEGDKITQIPRIYRCGLCPQTFTHFGVAERHKKSHGPNIQCMTCFAWFRTKTGVERHARQAHTTNSLSDHSINNSTESTSSSVTPSSITTNFSTLQCPICEKKCFSYPSLTTHIALHSAQRPYFCILCHCSFTILTTLISHCEKMHGILLESDRNPVGLKRHNIGDKLFFTICHKQLSIPRQAKFQPNAKANAKNIECEVQVHVINDLNLQPSSAVDDDVTELISDENETDVKIIQHSVDLDIDSSQIPQEESYDIHKEDEYECEDVDTTSLPPSSTINIMEMSYEESLFLL